MNFSFCYTIIHPLSKQYTYYTNIRPKYNVVIEVKERGRDRQKKREEWVRERESKKRVQRGCGQHCCARLLHPGSSQELEVRSLGKRPAGQSQGALPGTFHHLSLINNPLQLHSTSLFVAHNKPLNSSKSHGTKHAGEKQQSARTLNLTTLDHP